MAGTISPNPKRAIRADEITPTLRKALDAMVHDGLPYADAAARHNLSAYQMRTALQRPHVLAYLKQQRQMLLSSEGIRTIHRMIAIRDKTENMPAVTAGRVLLDLEAEQRASTASESSYPGVTIHINGLPNDAEPRTINQTASVNEGRPATNQQLITIDQPPGLDADDEP